LNTLEIKLSQRRLPVGFVTTSGASIATTQRYVDHLESGELRSQLPRLTY